LINDDKDVDDVIIAGEINNNSKEHLIKKGYIVD
jgi:hypothetical protein